MRKKTYILEPLTDDFFLLLPDKLRRGASMAGRTSNGGTVKGALNELIHSEALRLGTYPARMRRTFLASQ